MCYVEKSQREVWRRCDELLHKWAKFHGTIASLSPLIRDEVKPTVVPHLSQPHFISRSS